MSERGEDPPRFVVGDGRELGVLSGRGGDRPFEHRVGDQSNCVTTACYSEQVGNSPVRIEFRPGLRWHDADPYEPFPGDAGHAFNLYLMPPFGTAETPLLLYLDQRTDTFLTFFYNREGSPGFTALPDA